ncbi:MAG: hypothetical protein OEQ18_06785 [Gammaproteobacteria bacterium]|nr:hypothetical protein [Gammaproteobacteria bacterium]
MFREPAAGEYRLFVTPPNAVGRPASHDFKVMGPRPQMGKPSPVPQSVPGNPVVEKGFNPQPDPPTSAPATGYGGPDTAPYRVEGLPNFPSPGGVHLANSCALTGTLENR